MIRLIDNCELKFENGVVAEYFHPSNASFLTK